MYEAIEPKATLVALNYNCLTAKEFFNKLEERDIIEKYELKLQDMQWQGDLPSQQILNDLRPMLPYVYITKDTTIKVIYTQNEFKLTIEKRNLAKDNFSIFQELSNDILDLKLSDITAIGINYSAKFNLNKAKLNLLNNDIISEIPDFKNNLTFEFVLPIAYEERGLIETYRIKKESGGDDTEEPRIYSINANFHFDLSQLSTSQKADKLKEILSYDCYDEFFEKSQGFLRLNNGAC